MAETTALLLDEHVPRILETTLAANGYETVRADDWFGRDGRRGVAGLVS